MTKKGFTLMELLVSIFITGMVMLSLVAMWRTSSNQTAQAQRQSVIRNENTIFLRRFYNDFISASEVLCPWAYSGSIGDVDCTVSGNTGSDKVDVYVAVKEAVIIPGNVVPSIGRITEPVCGDSNNEWGTVNNNAHIQARCIAPTYVMYIYDKEQQSVFRCENTFINASNWSQTPVNTAISNAYDYCKTTTGARELILPYVSDFNLTVTQQQNPESYHTMFPELLIDYSVNREFGEGIPPVTFKFRRLLTKKRGV